MKTSNVCSSTVGKKFQLVRVNKQALFWKLETPTLKSSFEHLLTYLSLSINGLLEIRLQLLTFYFKILKYFLRQQPCFQVTLRRLIAGLRCCASHASIVQSRGWLPKVDQAPGYAKHGTIHQEIQLLMTTKEQNKNSKLTANKRKRNKQTNVPAMKAVVRNILCTVI